jgi:hypothetical protein
VTASQPGDSTFANAPDVSQTFAIAKATQTIDFSALADKTFGDADLPLSALASSGLAVSFAASGNCTLTGPTVHLTGVGSCTVTSSQSGNSNYNAAPDVSRTFSIAKGNQSITFGAPPSKTFGDADFTVSASASSGLPVAFAASGVCTISGSTVHITTAGSCTLTASQPGNANFNAAANNAQTVAVAKANQTITFGALADKPYGAANFTVSATASSGLAVSFSATGKCTVSGATVHLTGSGSCTITAAQVGNANYNAAPVVSRTFSIKAPCTVPKVTGKTLTAAKTALARGHCRAGTVGHAFSNKTKRGRVISQSRRAGQVLGAGSKVNLVVSRGRRH